MKCNRSSRRGCSETPLGAVVFPTELGWMAMIMQGRAVLQLAIGHRSRHSALAALDCRLLAGEKCPPSAAQTGYAVRLPNSGQRAALAEREQYAFSPRAGQDPRLRQSRPGEADSPGGADSGEALVGRLRAYAAGQPVDFHDVAIDLGPQSDFQRRVVRCCRRIAYGKTATYGQLARLAGFPGAARAVGQVMAANRVPIIVPCHRVVAAGGSLGGFSAPGGVALKRRLLELEQKRGRE